MASKNETRVAVFLGGRSPEHDVSVITGLQALKAIDQERFVAFPVYVNPRGAWFVGEALAERRNYLPDALSALLGNMGFPCIVKPAHLGSSIGVGKADDVEEVRALLPAIFRLDRQAVIEPFVPNLAEYNVAVARIGGVVRTSAIEKPKRAEELLDFRQKYLSGGDGNGGVKS